MHIEDILKNKCLEEKYFKSIIYLTHSFKCEDREKIIMMISKYNIYLATQCATSCEENKILEDQLCEIALKQTESDNIYYKIQGYLALVQLEKFEILRSSILNITDSNRENRNLIIELVNNIPEDEIVSIIEVLCESGNKSLLNAAITTTFNREIEFIWEDNKKIMDLCKKVELVFKRNDYRMIKFYLALNVPKKLLPSNIDFIIPRMIKKNKYNLCKEVIDKYNLNYKYTTYDLCNLYVSRNRHGNVLSFSRLFSNLEDNQKIELLKKAIKNKKYFYPFIISLIQSDEKMKAYIITKKLDEKMIRKIYNYRKRNIRCDDRILKQVILDLN